MQPEKVRQYEKAYSAWVGTLPAHERDRLAAHGLDRPAPAWDRTRKGVDGGAIEPRRADPELRRAQDPQRDRSPARINWLALNRRGLKWIREGRSGPERWRRVEVVDAYLNERSIAETAAACRVSYEAIRKLHEKLLEALADEGIPRRALKRKL